MTTPTPPLVPEGPPGPNLCVHCGKQNVPAIRAGWKTPVCFVCVLPNRDEISLVVAALDRLATAEALALTNGEARDLAHRQVSSLIEQAESDHEAYEAMRAKVTALVSEQDAELAKLRADDWEGKYGEVAEAIGYVNRAEGGEGYAVADHATILGAVRHLVSGEIDAAEFAQMATKLGAAETERDELRGRVTRAEALLRRVDDLADTTFAEHVHATQATGFNCNCPYCAVRAFLAPAEPNGANETKGQP